MIDFSRDDTGMQWTHPGVVTLLFRAYALLAHAPDIVSDRHHDDEETAQWAAEVFEWFDDHTEMLALLD